VLFIFVEEKNENAHSVHVIRKWRWKGVGVGDKEPVTAKHRLMDCMDANAHCTGSSVFELWLPLVNINSHKDPSLMPWLHVK